MKNLIFWIIFLLSINVLLSNCKTQSDSSDQTTPPPKSSTPSTQGISQTPQTPSQPEQLSLDKRICIGLQSIHKCLEDLISYRGGDHEAEYQKCFLALPYNNAANKLDALNIVNYLDSLNRVSSLRNIGNVNNDIKPPSNLAPGVLDNAVKALHQKQLCYQANGVVIGEEPRGLGQMSATSVCRITYFEQLITAFNCSPASL